MLQRYSIFLNVQIQSEKKWGFIVSISNKTDLEIEVSNMERVSKGQIIYYVLFLSNNHNRTNVHE